VTAHPLQRLLGVDPGAGPEEILGLPAGAPTRVVIERALRDRLEETYRHPEGRTPDAELARERVRDAARTLFERLAAGATLAARRASPRADEPGARWSRAARPARVRRGHAHALTPFDHHALAILVACGGWNARSRRRLVALAASHGVTADGLQKVLLGLSEYASAGGAPVVAETSAGAARPAAAPPEPEKAEPPPEPEEEPEAIARKELWTTIRLSILFGALVLILGTALVVNELRSGRERAAADASAAAAEVDAPPAPTAVESAAPPAPAPPVRAPLPLATMPTFLGNALPTAASDAADRSPRLPEEIEQIARRLEVADDPSGAIFHLWDAAIETAGSGWVITDRSTRDVVERAIVGVLAEMTDAPTTADRLLGALAPPRGRLEDPIDLWRGAYGAGILGSAARQAVPAAVRERAAAELASALGHRAEPGMSFESAAGAWLDAAVPGLVAAIEHEPRTYDFWEMWLAAERVLGGGERYEAGLAAALAEIVRAPADLARAGPSLDVLGRLLATADLAGSDAMRGAIHDLFDDAERVTDRDLWVLTSVLARLKSAEWFEETLVLPEEAGPTFRARIRDRIAAAWPSLGEAAPERGGALAVDRALAARWHEILRAIDVRSSPLDRPEDHVARHGSAAQLNEAAALLAARRTPEAIAILDGIDAARRVAGASRGPAATAPRGQPIGADGEWTAAYVEAKRDVEARLQILRALRTQAGSDLGPLDAETFVNEVYRGTPEEIRTLARTIVVEQFARGANVAMEMLDQLPGAPETAEIAVTIRGFAGRIAAPSGEATAREARLALIEHALALRGARSNLDDGAEALRQAYVAQAALLERASIASAAVETPQASARALADAWLERARLVMASDPVPGDLAALARRRGTRLSLAEGPIQELVAEQLAVLDALCYITVAEQPGAAITATVLLAESAHARRRLEHVLAQALEVELAIGRMWALRMGLTSGGSPARNGGEP
jgi:hypothetical protein